MMDDILAILMAPDEPTSPGLPTLTVEVTCRECHGTGQHQHARRGCGGTITVRCHTCQGKGVWTTQTGTISIDTFLAQVGR